MMGLAGRIRWQRRERRGKLHRLRLRRLVHPYLLLYHSRRRLLVHPLGGRPRRYPKYVQCMGQG